jgi:hypothetical protein
MVPNPWSSASSLARSRIQTAPHVVRVKRSNSAIRDTVRCNQEPEIQDGGLLHGRTYKTSSDIGTSGVDEERRQTFFLEGAGAKGRASGGRNEPWKGS